VVRTVTHAVFEEQYKTAGMALLKNSIRERESRVAPVNFIQDFASPFE